MSVPFELLIGVFIAMCGAIVGAAKWAHQAGKNGKPQSNPSSFPAMPEPDNLSRNDLVCIGVLVRHEIAKLPCKTDCPIEDK